MTYDHWKTTDRGWEELGPDPEDEDEEEWEEWPEEKTDATTDQARHSELGLPRSFPPPDDATPF